MNYKKQLLKAGEQINVSTNFELLNMLLGTQLKGWMSSIYNISDNEFIWMIKLDGIKRKGWKNSYSQDKIIEEYLDGKPYPTNIYTGYTSKRRFVFEKCNNRRTQYFIFRGIYQIDDSSTLTHRVLRLVSKETFF